MEATRHESKLREHALQIARRANCDGEMCASARFAGFVVVQSQCTIGSVCGRAGSEHNLLGLWSCRVSAREHRECSHSLFTIVTR